MKTISLKETLELKRNGADISDESGNPWQDPSMVMAIKEIAGLIGQLVAKPPPQISVEAPQVNVAAPTVTVSVPKAAPPVVNIEAPNVTVMPAPVDTAKKWKFTIIRDFRKGYLNDSSNFDIKNTI